RREHARLGEQRRGAAADGVVHERGAVGLASLADDEEIPGLDAAGVVLDPEDPRGRIALERGAVRQLADELREREPLGRAGLARERGSAAGHEAGSNTSRTLVPFGTASPAEGACFTRRPVPRTSGTRPAALTTRTASRAPRPWASG